MLSNRPRRLHDVRGMTDLTGKPDAVNRRVCRVTCMTLLYCQFLREG